MGVKTYLDYIVAKVSGNKEKLLKSVVDLVFRGSVKQSLVLNFNLYAINAKVHILNCVIAKRPFPPAGVKHLLTTWGHTFFCFYSVNNFVKLPEGSHILLARQFVITNAIEVNVYLCIAPKEVYEAFKAEVKDGFDEFEDLVDKMKREVRQQ
jgi:hypothetical protein